MSTASHSQSERLGKLHTDLAFDTLALLRFDGMDAVNECFEYNVEAVTEDENTALDLDTLLGTHMTVEIEDLYGTPKFFDGIVTECGWADNGDSGNSYRFTLRPWFWIMSKRTNCKIYQEKTFQEIITEVCGDFGQDAAGGLDVQLSGTFPAASRREYIVQYNESDFHFLSRLMERYGVNYYFTHEQGAHKMVVTDSTLGFKTLSPASRKYMGHEGEHVHDEEHFWDWTPNRRLTTGKVTLTDYNFKTVSANMEGTQEGDAEHDYGKLESYEYPGIHLNGGEGTAYARLRSEQYRARDKHHTASGDCLSLSSGMVFTLEGEHMDESLLDEEYLCIRAMHSFQTGGYRSGAGGGDGDSVFVGNYEMAPTAVPYAPERKTPETRMTGPQTATVTGAAGEEIDVDEFGRIVCQFHWDRLGQSDERSSMRIRVAQPWAGAGWGTLFIPRIGMEVIVEFLEGDPNKPVVTGCVYNGDNAPPYDQPGDKNWNGIKSNSTLGGGGYNELVFNDTQGEELFRQHAQYDMETKVLNDERREVDNNRTTTIGHDETRNVKHDETHTIDNNNTYLIKGDENRTVNKNRETNIDKDDTLNIMGNQTTEVFKKITTNAYQDIAISSLTKITLTVGASSITIDPASIKLEAPMIEVNASAMLKTNGGAMAEHKAGGMMTIQAALVKIN